jgi:ferric-dicitrate binding protein FerR (iron transport regulator)
MDTARQTYLFQRYFNRAATEEERLELLDWIRRQEDDEAITTLMDRAWEAFQGKRVVFTEGQSERMLHDIMQKNTTVEDKPDSIRSRRVIHWPGIAAAATVMVLIATAYFWFARPKQATYQAPQMANDVAPGSNKATLTLANGTSITLDSTYNGTLAQQGNTNVVKLNGGRLVYNRKLAAYKNGSDQKAAAAYNTLTTPRGGQYQLRLPDGSKVWLNAASSLKYPTAFTGKDRHVELTGEAYFEIAKNRNKPFYVDVHGYKPGKDIQVQVLGTHFDVKAYKDEPFIRTTLLEGSVKIVHGRSSRLLRPDEQAHIGRQANAIQVTRVNVEDVVAWKNGFFHFKGDDMESIMRKLARWYDVKVIYEGAVPAGHYTGIISRQTNLSEVLKMLELSGVRFILQGREIMVAS